MTKLTSQTFDETINSASNLVVVDFFATWCGPCKMLSPVLEQAAAEMPEVSFYKVDIDEEMDLAGRFQVMSVPTLLFFKGGTAVQKSVGAISGQKLRSIIEAL